MNHTKVSKKEIFQGLWGRTKYKFSFFPVFLYLLTIVVACGSGERIIKQKESKFRYKLANNYYFDQNIPMALKELDKSIKLDPNNIKSLFLMGFILLGRKDYISAITNFKRALKLKPDFFAARENLGAIYLSMGDWNQAIKVLTPLLSERLYATPYLVQNNLGYAYQQKGENSKAIQHFKTALFLNPRFCLGYFNLGKAYMKTGNNGFAEKNFKRAIKFCPSYPNPYYLLGIIAEKRQQYVDSKKYFRKCVKFGGDSSIAERCTVRLGKGNFDVNK